MRPSVVARYLRRVSGPLLDRIGLHVDVPAVTREELTGERRGEPSRVVRERVTEAWARLDPALACQVGDRPRLPQHPVVAAGRVPERGATLV